MHNCEGGKTEEEVCGRETQGETRGGEEQVKKQRKKDAGEKEEEKARESEEGKAEYDRERQQEIKTKDKKEILSKTEKTGILCLYQFHTRVVKRRHCIKVPFVWKG